MVSDLTSPNFRNRRDPPAKPQQSQAPQGRGKPWPSWMKIMLWNMQDIYIYIDIYEDWNIYRYM